MEIIRESKALRDALKVQKAAGKTIGLVPTMGYFHEGHLALMREARKECQVVVVSIFVNPLQFGPAEDLAAYPRDLERDLALAVQEGVNFVFIPEEKEMYPEDYATHVEVERLTSVLCGRSRPGHFRGVTTVVAKLFNLVQPDYAFFGQKDAQQAIVIQRMVRDLNFPLEIVVIPTVREADGLAMSSRNVYLNPQERESARVLYRALQKAEELIRAGEHRAGAVKNIALEMLCKEPRVQVDYFEIRDAENLRELEMIRGKVLVALAAWVGKARLIDNIMLEVE